MANQFADPTGLESADQASGNTIDLNGQATSDLCVNKGTRQPSAPSPSTPYLSVTDGGLFNFSFFRWTLSTLTLPSGNVCDGVIVWIYLDATVSFDATLSTGVYAPGGWSHLLNSAQFQPYFAPGSYAYVTVPGAGGGAAGWYGVVFARKSDGARFTASDLAGLNVDVGMNSSSGHTIRITEVYVELQLSIPLQTVGDSIGFSGGNSNTESRAKSVSDTSTFSHSGVQTTSRELDIADTLTFVDLGTGSKAFASMEVVFADVVSLEGSYYNLTVTDQIAFLDIFRRVIDVDLLDAIVLGGAEAIRGPTLFPVEVVAFADVGGGQCFKLATTSIAFSDGATRASIAHTRTKSDSIQFQDYAYETVQVPGSYQAQIQVGPIVKDCDRYSTSLSISSSLVLSYPVNTPTNTVTLKVPRFGNERNYTVMTKVKRTLDQFPRVVRASTWPKIETHHFSFGWLTVTQRDAFLAFMDLTAGQMIRLVDQDGVNWQGVITDAVPVTKQEGPGCQFSLEFTFRGTVI